VTLYDPRRRVTLQGWRHWYDEMPLTPPLIVTWSEYEQMDPIDRRAYDHGRLFSLSRGLRVTTREMERAGAFVKKAVAFNELKGAGERGIIITGPPVNGKTTIVNTLGWQTEYRRARENPSYRDHGEVPVVFIDAISNCSGKGLLQGIYRYFTALPVAVRTNTNQYLDLVLEQLWLTRTLVLIIDEAHNLASRRDLNGDPTDIIKLLQNQGPATVVLSGVNLVSHAVFGTTRGLQVVARCDRVTLQPCTLSTKATIQYFQRLAGAFDRRLPLIDHQPGLLAANYRELHAVTGGIIGRLAHLVEDLAADILLNPDRHDERLTERRLTRVLKAYASRSSLSDGRAEPPINESNDQNLWMVFGLVT
jgi:hypothetical protein